MVSIFRSNDQDAPATQRWMVSQHHIDRLPGDIAREWPRPPILANPPTHRSERLAPRTWDEFAKPAMGDIASRLRTRTLAARTHERSRPPASLDVPP